MSNAMKCFVWKALFFMQAAEIYSPVLLRAKLIMAAMPRTAINYTVQGCSALQGDYTS